MFSPISLNLGWESVSLNREKEEDDDDEDDDDDDEDDDELVIDILNDFIIENDLLIDAIEVANA